jgi:hypothetical protein
MRKYTVVYSDDLIAENGIFEEVIDCMWEEMEGMGKLFAPEPTIVGFDVKQLRDYMSEVIEEEDDSVNIVACNKLAEFMSDEKIDSIIFSF